MKHQAPTLACAKYQIWHFFDFCRCKSLCKYFFRKYYFANYLKIILAEAEAKFGTLCCVVDISIAIIIDIYDPANATVEIHKTCIFSSTNKALALLLKNKEKGQDTI